MYAQLGSIVFQGTNSFNEQTRSDSANYAQHDTINGKPRLQPTGNNLEQINLSMKLRADFISPEQMILSLKRSKDQFEVLPLVLGNGRYLGDYVIMEMGEAVINAFADGAIIEATIQITLMEFITPDKLQQKENAARKQGFALGSKKPIKVSASQQPTISQLAALDVSDIKSQSAIVDSKASDWEHNVTQRSDISKQISGSLDKMSSSITSLQQKINNIFVSNDSSILQGSINNLINTIGEFELPVQSLSILQLNSLNLQSSMKGFKTASRILTNPVIMRAA